MFWHLIAFTCDDLGIFADKINTKNLRMKGRIQKWKKYPNGSSPIALFDVQWVTLVSITDSNFDTWSISHINNSFFEKSTNNF